MPRSAMLSVLAGALFATACAQPPQHLVSVAPFRAPEGGLPAVLALLPGQDAAFVPPPPPAARSGLEVAGRTAAATVLYPLAGAVVLPLVVCGPAALVCIPLAIVTGATMGVAGGVGEGVSAANQDVRSPEDVAAAVVTIRRVVDPARIGDCLRDTLVGRAEGRLVAAPAGSSGPGLSVGLGSVALSIQGDSPMRGSNPPLVLNLTAIATLRTDAAMSPSGERGGQWRWASEPRRYFAATAEEGRVLHSEIEIAVGALAQRILADLYPGLIAPPTPRRGVDEQRFRASCPELAPVAAAGQTGPAEGIAPRR
jgi:hypothetical protein